VIKKRATASVLFASLLALALAIGALVYLNYPSEPWPPTLDPNLSWHADNRARLDALLATVADTHTKTPDQRQVAVFDWDNTMIANDVGAATVHHMLRAGGVRRLPDDDWGAIPYLTATAQARLAAVCPPQPDAIHLPTSASVGCADELVHLYEKRTLADGMPAFSGYDHRRYKPSAALQVHLLAGYRPADVRDIAGRVVAAALAAPVGSKHAVGRIQVPAWLRIYPQMADLLSAMQRAGAEVWIVSASPQEVVEVIAARVGVPADRVVGIRALKDDQGRLRRRLQGCGPVPDGGGLLTYIDGKRCWINKVIYGDKSADAMTRAPADRRPLFAAGDTGTDISMLLDATRLRLVIDRQNPAVLCHARHDVGPGHWLVQPRFLQPRPMRTQPYPCSSAACVAADGRLGPCIYNGEALADR